MAKQTKGPDASEVLAVIFRTAMDNAVRDIPGHNAFGGREFHKAVVAAANLVRAKSQDAINQLDRDTEGPALYR